MLSEKEMPIVILWFWSMSLAFDFLGNHFHQYDLWSIFQVFASPSQLIQQRLSFGSINPENKSSMYFGRQWSVFECGILDPFLFYFIDVDFLFSTFKRRFHADSSFEVSSLITSSIQKVDWHFQVNFGFAWNFMSNISASF